MKQLTVIHSPISAQQSEQETVSGGDFRPDRREIDLWCYFEGKGEREKLLQFRRYLQDPKRNIRFEVGPAPHSPAGAQDSFLVPVDIRHQDAVSRRANRLGMRCEAVAESPFKHYRAMAQSLSQQEIAEPTYRCPCCNHQIPLEELLTNVS